jgi:membrane protease YdiL (CAAX protease family)
MESEPTSKVRLEPPKPPPSNWLMGAKGLRPGWRLLIYFLLLLALSAVATIGARGFARTTYRFPNSFGLLMQEVVGFAVVLGAAFVMSRIEARSVGDYGLPISELFGGKFWLGFLFGVLEISLLMGLISAFGGYSFGGLALQGSDIIRWALLHLLLFLFVGLFEEFLFRGYSQFTLADGIGFWPAALLLSIGFGAIHLGNAGEGPVGAASVALVGLFFCFTLWRTGSLWYAVGLHASFDWGETYLFSVPNSGIVLQGHLSNSALHGSNWLTGGSIGPEGSVFCFLTMGLQFLVVALLFPAKKKAPAESVATVV